MINIFFRSGKEIVSSMTETEFAKLKPGQVLWIDLLEPKGEEKRAVEAFLGTEIQSRAQAEEIESSSRFSEVGNAIFANTNYISPEGDELSEDPVSFTLVGGTLATLRDIPLRSFTSLQRKMMARPQLYKDGFAVFVAILEQRVDLDADIIELMGKDTAQFSKRINQREDINEEFLLDITQLQENTMVVRESVVDKQRLISNILKAYNCPSSLKPKLGVLLQDIGSLINHTNFTFERLEFLQDTVVGLINLDQNRIMKVFTVISVLLMPATLVASFYGMNVHLPFEGLRLAWLWILLFMFLIVVAIWFVFKHRDLT